MSTQQPQDNQASDTKPRPTGWRDDSVPPYHKCGHDHVTSMCEDHTGPDGGWSPRRWRNRLLCANCGETLRCNQSENWDQ